MRWALGTVFTPLPSVYPDSRHAFHVLGPQQEDEWAVHSGPVGPELEKGGQIYQERRKKNRNGFKKKKENEKEGSWEKEREKAQSTPLVSPVHSWPQVPAEHTHRSFQGNPSSSQDLE